MDAGPELRAVKCRPRIKPSMRAVIVICIDRFPQIIRTHWIFWSIVLLRIVTCPGEIMIEQGGRNFVYANRGNGGHANENLPAWIV